jgi:hypothetical protein
MRAQEVVDSAMRASDAGVPDSENANRHGVAVATIRRWRRLYQRRGLARGQAHLSATCPRCDGGPLDAEAYAELLGWYLGDGHISRAHRDVYALHIYNDLAYPRLSQDVADLMRRVKPGCRPHTRQLRGCLAITVSWKHWPCLFPQHGPGRKHERTLRLEDWQRDIVTAAPAALVRGLMHSDGCRVNNWARRTVAGEPKRYDYPRWQFVNHSADIRAWCCDALDLLDVPWRASSWRTIPVSTRAGVARLDELVGRKR